MKDKRLAAVLTKACSAFLQSCCTHNVNRHKTLRCSASRQAAEDLTADRMFLIEKPKELRNYNFIRLQ